uniref:helix-turn-helix transcriptional regulator n=1 Tax=Scandinavium goeteborgense TaxID=1851514 RepID=UPI001C67CF50|nr:LuxR C-terminal-related transcriptional regulator [Scandinavium goeteborgense]
MIGGSIAIYLFSDDHYFSVGISRLLQKENITVNVCLWERWEPVFLLQKVIPGDILLLDGRGAEFTRRSISFPLNQRIARIFIFYDSEKGLLPVFARWQHGPRTMSPEYLRDALIGLYRQTMLQEYCPGWLTTRESQVLSRIYDYSPCYRIARDLSISIKTISAHKIRALRKMGVGSIHELRVGASKPVQSLPSRSTL